MTGNRVTGIQKFAVLIALGALLPAAAAQSSETGGCLEPAGCAYYTCQDFNYWYEGFNYFDSVQVCQATCKRFLQTCLDNVVMCARCMDRFNKDFRSAGQTACKDEVTSPTPAECREYYAEMAAYMKQNYIKDSAIEGREYCVYCYENCLSACE